jgi:spore germination protein KB
LVKEKISSSQLTILITGFILGSFLLVTFSVGITRHDTWIAVLLGCLASMGFAYLYLTLASWFPGRTLIEINDIIYGTILGKIISILYIWFFFSLSALNLRVMGEFFITFFLQGTPPVIIYIMITFICAWAVREGIEVISRTSFLLVIITATIIITLTLLLVNEMRFENLLPILEVSVPKLIHGSHIIAAIPFGEAIVFIMVIAYLNKEKEIKKSVYPAYIFSGIIMLIITIRNAAVLGNTDSIFLSTPFQAARLVNIGDILTRIEVLILIAMLATIFLKISMFYFASVTGVARLLKLRSYTPLVAPFGILSICLTIIMFRFSPEISYFGANVFPIYSLPFEVFIPLLSLIIGKIKGYPKREQVNCQ